MSATTESMATDGGHTAEVEFAVSGMTCGSCAARVEKVLGRHDGVAGAGVNFATGKAVVTFDPSQVTCRTIGYPMDNEDLALAESRSASCPVDIPPSSGTEQ